MEEVVGHGVLLGQLALGHIGGIIMAHYQPRRVAPGNKLVHLAAVYLIDFLVIPVHKVAGLLVGWHILGSVKRSDRQIGREAGVGRGWLLGRIDRLGQRCIRSAVLVHLVGGGPRVSKPIGSRETAV